jgi:hypothetical protein
MNPVPTDRRLFWACYFVGTLCPFLDNFLMSHSRWPYRDGAFLWSWLLWLFGAGLLVGCVWSVRTILLGSTADIQRPVLLYRLFGWLAVIESLVWIYTVVRVM